ncbi:MAG: DUF1453 domain-containing protein [Acidobacteriota bacterium]|nr:DUF1453 domain-containing protein [Acidobacteriota bacterium]
MPLPFLLLALPVVLLALTPFLLVLRYRAGTARRLARRWVATVSLAASAISVSLFLFGAAVTTIWVPQAFSAAAAGLLAGCALGLLGLALTRWELTARTLHYTPNRWLVVAITLMVSARVLYGLWRSWLVARSGADDTSLVMAFGVPESLAVGATVLGYYLAYSAGLGWQIRRWERRALRVL